MGAVEFVNAAEGSCTSASVRARCWRGSRGASHTNNLVVCSVAEGSSWQLEQLSALSLSSHSHSDPHTVQLSFGKVNSSKAIGCSATAATLLTRSLEGASIFHSLPVE